MLGPLCLVLLWQQQTLAAQIVIESGGSINIGSGTGGGSLSTTDVETLQRTVVALQATMDSNAAAFEERLEAVTAPLLARIESLQHWKSCLPISWPRFSLSNSDSDVGLDSGQHGTTSSSFKQTQLAQANPPTSGAYYFEILWTQDSPRLGNDWHSWVFGFMNAGSSNFDRTGASSAPSAGWSTARGDGTLNVYPSYMCSPNYWRGTRYGVYIDLTAQRVELSSMNAESGVWKQCAGFDYAGTSAITYGTSGVVFGMKIWDGNLWEFVSPDNYTNPSIPANVQCRGWPN